MEETYLTRSSAVAARSLGGEMMIMSAVDSTLFSLNEVATIIWQAADGSMSLNDIVMSKVCAAFDVEPSLALEDAAKIVQELVAYGLLLLSEPRTMSSAAEHSIQSVVKRPYQKPAFRYELAFETTALSCGKVNPTQLQCQFTKKNS
jgi:hypothetical protein